MTSSLEYFYFFFGLIPRQIFGAAEIKARRFIKDSPFN